MLKRIFRRFMRYYRKWFRQQNYIFKHEGPFMPDERTDCIIKNINESADLSESVRIDILNDGEKKRLDIDEMELNENSTMWLVFMDGHVVSTVFTRQGKYFKNWFLPLNDDDVVVFRLRTHPDYRGRGLAPSMIRQAIHETLKNSKGSAFIDCRTYNKSSIACIKKVGFKCVAKMKTISRDWALYG